MSQLLEEVCAIVAEVLDVEPASLSAESTVEDMEEWDSIAHLNIITSLEASYDTEIDLSNAMELTSIGGILAYLEAHLDRV